MEYLRKFDNHSEYDAAKDNLIRPNVSYCVQENEVHYNPIDYSIQYLTFEVVESGTITLTASSNYVSKIISYKVNDNEWTELTTTTTAQTLGGTLSKGDKVLVKGNNDRYAFDDGHAVPHNYFGGTAKVNVYGNIMSLVSGDNFADNKELTLEFTFYYLFKNYSNLQSAEHLILPATTLTNECYMYMFNGCASLTTAPELPATTLVTWCYEGMFIGCTSLNYIKCLATDISAANCTTSWLYNASSSGTFVKAASMTSWSRDASGIPSGWTVVDA